MNVTRNARGIMSSAGLPEPLLYGRRRRSPARRYWMLVSVAALAALLALVNARFGWYGMVQLRCAELYWQHRLATEAVRSDAVAVDTRVAMRQGMVGDGSLFDIQDLFGDCGGTPSVAWEHLAAILPPGMGARQPARRSGAAVVLPPGPTLFAGRLRSSTSVRFVHVTLDQLRDVPDVGWAFAVTILTPATLASPPSSRHSSTWIGWVSTDRPVAGEQDKSSFQTVFRGKLDPAEPARFTCLYETDGGHRHSIEGTLSADGGAVRIRYLVGPDTVRSSAAVKSDRNSHE